MSSLLFAILLAQPAPEAELPEGEAPFTEAQLQVLEEREKALLEKAKRATKTEAPAPSPSIIELQAEAYIKWIYRNNASQGCVTYGNPHPSGDNYAGDNGACPEFSLNLIARPMAQIEAGFRIQSRFGQQFADYFENGDKRPTIDGSSESLGQNHAAYLALRGIYVRVAQPLPLIDWFLAGSNDLGFFDPWTVGRVRFIERFNSKGLFLQSSAGDYGKLILARIALNKLYGTANYNSLEEPLLSNPFWARDAIYAASLSTGRGVSDKFTITWNSNLILDEEADARDPDAPGSTNTVDARDDVVAVAPRFVGFNSSLTARLSGFDSFRGLAILAFSHNNPDTDYVTNLALGGLGFSNIVYDTTTDFAALARLELPELFSGGTTLKLEYFNVGANFNAMVGSRREDDVLLTDGFLGWGQLPTLNLANEIMDFNDGFYESIIGWHGATLLVEQTAASLDLSAEFTAITYNTNLQDRNMDIYPGFGGFTGYTDTQLFSYANTNDRGRDPRMVYARDQDRVSFLVVGKGNWKPGWWRGATLDLKLKFIRDQDGRDAATDLDDYAGNLMMGEAAVGGQLLDMLSMKVGFAADYWMETGRSGTYAGGEPRFLDYDTVRLRPYVDFRYSLGPLSAVYHLETVKKSISTTDPAQDYQSGLVFRSIGWISAQF